jgi:hypothetical protein
LFYKAFWEREPVAVIANSTRVYWVDEWPEAPSADVEPSTHLSLGDALLMGMRWPEQAVRAYRTYLTLRPDDPQALTRMGIALAESGRGAESISAFTRVTELAPGDENARINLDKAHRRYGRIEATLP